MMEIGPEWIDSYKRLKHDFWFNEGAPGREIIAQNSEKYRQFSDYLADVLPHQVDVDSTNIDLDWMKSNLQEPWVYWVHGPSETKTGTVGHYLAFRSADDATLFKLTWSGRL